MTRAVAEWIRLGGELVDTAELYRNHADIGAALTRCFPGMKRDGVWITSKVDLRRVDPDAGATAIAAAVRASTERAIRELGLTHVDLMLLHQSECGDGKRRRRGNNGVFFLRRRRRQEQGNHGDGDGDEKKYECVVEAWRELLRLQVSGHARAVGVSNFGVRHLEALVRAGLPLPAVNQIEFHPYISAEQRRTFEWCNRRGVAVTAYGNLGGSKRSGELPQAALEVAAEVGATPQQTMLAWVMRQPRAWAAAGDLAGDLAGDGGDDRGGDREVEAGSAAGGSWQGNVSIIPGTNNPEHQAANLRVPSVAASLTQMHLKRIDRLGKPENVGTRPDGWRSWKNIQHEASA